MVNYIITNHRGTVLREGKAENPMAALLIAENYCNGLKTNNYCFISEQYKSATVKVATFRMYAPYGEPVQIMGEEVC